MVKEGVRRGERELGGGSAEPAACSAPLQSGPGRADFLRSYRLSLLQS